jgi:hypothetical protein
VMEKWFVEADIDGFKLQCRCSLCTALLTPGAHYSPELSVNITKSQTCAISKASQTSSSSSSLSYKGEASTGATTLCQVELFERTCKVVQVKRSWVQIHTGAKLRDVAPTASVVAEENDAPKETRGDSCWSQIRK